MRLRGRDIAAVDHTISQSRARNAPEARGVWVRLSDAVTRIDAKAVHLASGVRVPCQTAIWAAGVKANPLAGALGLEQGRAGRGSSAPT
jgi:NADH dehydrogenase